MKGDEETCMFKKILFSTNGSSTCDNAARVAFDFASKWDSELILFHVIGTPSRGFSPFIRDSRTGEDYSMDSDYSEWVVDEIENTYGNFLKNSKKSVIKTTVGQPYREILRHARSENVDMIILGAHGHDADALDSERNGVSPTMRKVAKSAKCPVLAVTRPCSNRQYSFSSVVFGTDFSQAADFAFEWARKLARKSGAALHIFHALDISKLKTSRTDSQIEIENRIKAAEKRIQIKYMRDSEGMENGDSKVWEGTPYIEILKFAREKEADLIVMAHHAREIDPNSKEADLGSVTEQVVLRSACPVVSVNYPEKAED